MQTQNGNYKFKNFFGTILKTVYPLHKLKVVSSQDDNTPHQEFENILNHRFNQATKSYEYLVKWKEFDDDENNWEPELSFDTLDIINKYWKKVHTVKPNNTMHLLRFTPYGSMLWFFCLNFCCAPASAFVTIHDSVPFCDNSKTPTLVDAVKSCYHSRDEAAKTA
jgi:hypothetical protein